MSVSVVTVIYIFIFVSAYSLCFWLYVSAVPHVFINEKPTPTTKTTIHMSEPQLLPVIAWLQHRVHIAYGT